MKAIILQDEVHEFAKFMFKKYVHESIEPEELWAASELWKALMTAVDIPNKKDDETEVVSVQGPLEIEVDLGELR